MWNANSLVAVSISNDSNHYTKNIIYIYIYIYIYILFNIIIAL